jgi:hypothetical protein
MKESGNGKPLLFRIIVSQFVSQQIKAEYTHAKPLGQGSAFREILAKLEKRLSQKAKEFGEPRYELGAMQIRHGIVLPIHVEYGVHLERALVFLRRILFLAPGANNQ